MEFPYQNMVLSAKDVAYLITKREQLGKLVFSVKGTVTALSDVTRAGKNQMFLVDVDKCIIIIIKDFHLGWHSVLEVGDVFLFQNLKLTTLEKGISKPCSVLLALETSSLICLKDQSAVTPVSLQDWLKINSISDVLKSETSNGTNGEETEELVNYEGTVTSTDMAPLGIFVLDGKLRLVAASGCVAGIKKHSRVSVYNAHIVKDGVQAYLVCCMRSCIRIHESVSSVGDSAVSLSTDEIETCVATSIETKNNKLRIQKFIRKFSLNLKEVLALQQLYSILSRQGRSTSWQEKLFAQFIKSDVCANLTNSGVQATDLFIFHEQLCSFNQSKSEDSRIPQIMDLHALKNELTNIKSTLDSASVLTQPGIKIQSSPHHLKACFSSGKILVGCIQTCTEGTEFGDGTTKFRVIILSDSHTSHTDSERNSEDTSRCCKDTTDHQRKPHLCCQDCFNRCQPGKQLTCPVLDPWLVGATVCVTKFHVVLEGDFETRTQDASKSGKEKDGDIFIYLAFSLLDCILLDDVENILPAMASSERGSASVLLPANLSSHGRLARKNKCQQESTCYVFVHEKQPLTHTGNLFKDRRCCQFQLLGCKIDLDLKTEKNVSCCEKACVRRKKDTFTASPEIVSSSSECVAERQENSLQDSHKQRSESICASFSNSAAKWYNCFTSGHLYRLFTSSSNGDPDPFKAKLLKVLPQKVTEYYNVRMNVQVPEDVFVERLPVTSPHPCWRLQDVGVLHPIGQIMSARMRSSIINIKLEVRDMLPDSKDNDASGRVVTVYLDAPKTVYTLGLVPGAVVKLHRLERKVSKVGNIYCRFIAVSLAEVVQFQDLSVSLRYTRSAARVINMENLPRELLFNIRQCSTEDRQTENQAFVISCHIEKIFSLHIKTVCSSCKSVFSNTGCQSRYCSSKTWPVVSTSAVLLVNDGTCPATVKIWDSNLISRLLTLTHSQWEDLVTEVTSQGEVVLNNSSSTKSNISSFLQELISSPLVLRPCRMAVKKYHGSVSSDLDKMRLQDFQENEVKVGRHFVRTLSLPRMQLDCLAISDMG